MHWSNQLHWENSNQPNFLKKCISMIWMMISIWICNFCSHQTSSCDARAWCVEATSCVIKATSCIEKIQINQIQTKNTSAWSEWWSATGSSTFVKIAHYPATLEPAASKTPVVHQRHQWHQENSSSIVGTTQIFVRMVDLNGTHWDNCGNNFFAKNGHDPGASL